MKTVDSLLLGSWKVNEMGIRIARTISSIEGCIQSPLYIPESCKNKETVLSWSSYSQTTEEPSNLNWRVAVWFYEVGVRKNSLRADCISPDRGVIYSNIGISLRLGDTQDVYLSLPIFVRGMMENIPALNNWSDILLRASEVEL